MNLALFQPSEMLLWLPGVALGIVMLAARERLKSPFVLPITFGLALAGFYLIALVTHTGIAQLSAGGWLLGPFPTGTHWQFPFTAETLARVNWAALSGQLPQLASVILVSVVALLLNASGLELIIKRDFNLNRELVSAGVGNMAAALIGGTVGYHAVSMTGVSRAVSGGTRLAGLLTAVLVGATALVGPAVLGYVPRLVLAAMLIYLGLDLIFEWVYRARFRFPHIDFLIVLSILGVVILRGFLEGVTVGLLLAVVMFLISYSRIPVARYAVSGESYRSRVLRTPQAQEILRLHGSELYVLKLQGFIFFGTAGGLYEQIRARTRDLTLPPLRYVVFDLSHVTGMDSTASLSIEKILRLAQEQAITLAVAGLHGRARTQMLNPGLLQTQNLKLFDDLDHAVEWCENEIISAHGTTPHSHRTLYEDFTAILPLSAGVDKLVSYMERMELAANAYLIRQGDKPDALYFIESGQFTTQLESPDKPPIRLETVRGGRSIGEIGFYLNIPRTASVVADEPGVVYYLSRENLEKIEATDSEAAYALHRLVIYTLGQRVRNLTHIVDVLER